eukprot:3735170-Amphidinium_carterae.1
MRHNQRESYKLGQCQTCSLTSCCTIEQRPQQRNSTDEVCRKGDSCTFVTAMAAPRTGTSCDCIEHGIRSTTSRSSGRK